MDDPHSSSTASIDVEVAVAWPDHQVSIAVLLPKGATIQDAITASKLQERYPNLEIDPAQVGIFAELRRMDSVLQAGDRVEIYRPLKADPKDVRRAMARSKKT